jgi:Glycine-zipper domain
MPGGYGAPPPAYPHPGYGYGVAGYSQPAAPPPYQQPYAYPQRGQSPEQSSDEFRACQTWASTQTGYNPSAPAATAAAPQTASAGASLVRGGARGAAVGAVGGAIGGDAGKGAAVGAAVGGMFSLMRRREEQQALEREEQAAAQGTIQKADAYNRALDACMSGRGYTVR